MFYEVTFRLLFRYFFIRNFVFVLLYRECYRFDRAFLLSGVFCLILLPTFPKVPQVLRSERTFFILRRFLTYILSQHLAQPAFIKASVGADTSSMKVAGPPTEVRNTDPAHIFV